MLEPDGVRLIEQVSINTAGDGDHRLFVRVRGESREALIDLQGRIEAWGEELREGTD